MLADRIEAAMRTVPDFPIPGIPFPDITSLLETDATLYRDVVDAFAEEYRVEPPDCIAAIESFGYVFGAPLAYLLGARLVLVRRAGKLPRPVLHEDYDMIYDNGRALEVHDDAVRNGDRVLLVDDVLASGGSALATIRLIERSGGECCGIGCVIDATILAEMPARKEITSRGIPVFALTAL